MGEKRREMGRGNRDAVLEAYKAFEDADPEISRVMTPLDLMFQDVPVSKQARLATRFSQDAVDALLSRRDFSDGYVAVLKSLDGTPWNELPKSFPQAAKAAGLKASLGLVDAVMSSMASADESAPPAVDRKGNPVAAAGWKMTERVTLSEDLSEHMEREVLPFAPDAQWDQSKARYGNEIPFTRIFFVPREPRPLAEIDTDVQMIMSELAEMFNAVSDE